MTSGILAKISSWFIQRYSWYDLDTKDVDIFHRTTEEERLAKGFYKKCHQEWLDNLNKK